MSLRGAAKRAINSVLQPAGIALDYVDPDSGRRSMAGCLANARKNGLAPRTVIDVGAARGTPDLYAAFPDGFHLLIDPLKEFHPELEKRAAELGRAKLVKAAAGAAPGEITFNVHPDLFGSSMFKEEEDSNVNGEPRTVPLVMIDSIVREHALEGPFVIKLDVQGAEIEALKGAEETLRQTEFVVAETQFFELYKGAPLASDLIAFMTSRGFFLYDIFSLTYRPLDGAISQVDMAFASGNSALRAHQHFATAAQRKEHDELVKKREM